MWGKRWIDITRSVTRDFVQCTGIVNDGLGCEDYTAFDITLKDQLCTPINVACKLN